METPNPITPEAGNEDSSLTAPVVFKPSEMRSKAPPTSSDENNPGTEPEKPADQKGQEPPKTPEDKEDYKTKFSESSKEAQRMLEIMKKHGIDPKTGEKIETTPPKEQPAPATRTNESAPPEQPPLTDTQLKTIIPGFENMSEEEKNVLRNVKSTAKELAEMKNLVAEINDERQYNKDFKALTSKEEWKKLAEHADEFKELAYQNENLQTPLETLAASFLYRKGLSNKPAEKPPAPKGIEPGTNGAKGGSPIVDDEMTPEQASELRKTDPRRYNALVRSKKLTIRES